MKWLKLTSKIGDEKERFIITYSAFPEGKQTALTNNKKKLSLIAECQLISTKEMIKSEKYYFINSIKLLSGQRGPNGTNFQM